MADQVRTRGEINCHTPGPAAVSDNGRGMGEVTRTPGLSDMRQRADSLGGTFHVASEPSAWTQLEWRVPLAQ